MCCSGRTDVELCVHNTHFARTAVAFNLLPGEYLVQSRGGVTHHNRAAQCHFHQPPRVASRRPGNVFDTNVTNSEIP